MINRLSNPSNRNHSAAKISKVMSSNCYPITAWMDVLLTLYVIAQTWGVFISTEGAHIRPMTYDNHPIHPNSHIALKTTSHELR